MDDSELANHEQEAAAAAAAAAPSIVCEYCLKSFTSGKAYGGHKRIHLQHQQHNTIMTAATTKIIKDEQEKEAEPPAAADAAEIGSDPKNNNNKQTVRKQIIRCSECFRFFKSWKSLFGHMRAHPERDWRGIKPPPSSSSSFSINASSTSCTISNLQLQLQIQDQDEYDDEEEEEEDEDFEAPTAQVLDLADSLRGRSWLSCDIRGRKAKIITTDNNLADDMNSSVDHLVHQAQNHSSSSEAANQAESIPDDDDDVLMNPIPKKKMKVEKLADHTRQCVCSICNKSFPCYQALGGHMASHNKGVIKKMAAGQEGELDQLSDTGGGRGCSVKIEEGDHQCNICGLSFLTGQALGGHKKRHWWSPNKEVTTTNPKAPLQSSSTTPSVKKLEFDLNEVPKGSD